MFLNLLIKRASGDTEALGGFLDATPLLLKNSFDVLLFEFQKSQARVEKRRADLSMTVEVKIV